MRLTFITGNIGKVGEVERYLDAKIDHVSLDLPEIQSLDSEEIVRDKAARAFEILKKPLLVEDSALVFNALGRLPGPLIKWFEKELGNEGLCRLLDGKDRRCKASVTYAYHDGRKIKIFSGSMSGTVSEHPRGTNSFGWAPIFTPTGSKKTYSEMTHKGQEGIAMRRKALAKLRRYLSKV